MHIYPLKSINFCANTNNRISKKIINEDGKPVVKEETPTYNILTQYCPNFYTVEFRPKHKPDYSSRIMRDYSNNKIKVDYNNGFDTPFKTRYYNADGSKRSVIYKYADLTPCICKIYDDSEQLAIREILVADFNGDPIAQINFEKNNRFEMLFNNGEANYKFYSRYSKDIKKIKTYDNIAKRTKDTNDSISNVYMSKNGKVFLETLYDKVNKSLGFIFYDKNEIPCATCTLNYEPGNKMYAKCAPVHNLQDNNIDGLLYDRKYRAK